MLYERSQHVNVNRNENRRTRIEPAILGSGKPGVGIKHGNYLIFLPQETALSFATRIADALEESKKGGEQ